MNKCDICDKEHPNLIESFDYDPDIGSYEVLICPNCLEP